jgi:hypothetical protein
MFFYSDTEKRNFTKPFYAEDYDANTMIAKHLENYFFLKFILMKSDSVVEKHQASKELDICERKMNYWKRQSNFCKKQYEKDIDRFKTIYEMH